MGRAWNPARDTRERLLMLERREKAKAEARAVAEGVAESVALSKGRGAAFSKEPAAKGGRETPYQRRSGLDWLHQKGRISEGQKAAGERYGACFRRAEAEAPIGSSLEIQPGGGARGEPALQVVLNQAARRAHAKEQLETLRSRLMAQPDLVGACDLICGRELTPREAGGGEREGLRLEAVLKVALDLLGTG